MTIESFIASSEETGESIIISISLCKAWGSEAYCNLVALGHQVVEGIGIMEEHDLHLYFRRAQAAKLAFGDADFHRERVAQSMGL